MTLAELARRRETLKDEKKQGSTKREQPSGDLDGDGKDDLVMTGGDGWSSIPTGCSTLDSRLSTLDSRRPATASFASRTSTFPIMTICFFKASSVYQFTVYSSYRDQPQPATPG